MHSVTLAQVFHKTDLFPTPMASEGTKAPSQQTSETKGRTGQVWLSNVAKDLEQTDKNIDTNWGKFAPAIKRWETILGRPAPEPTKPDGKDNNHRLSSKFTEWMMGLPDGWITGHDLKRNDELKLAGNGVVPQQAELALRLLLELPERKENDNE
jgi:DNA (cytosine-5)-methyltransferase 1